MKKSVIILSVLFALIYGCKQNQEQQSVKEPKAEINFETIEYDFGNIDYESDGRCHFEFTNTSRNSLIINRVRSSCGCTRPEWPDEPIAPGESGRIGISYNTAIVGTFRKSLTVYANTSDSPIKLYIKGNVKPKTTD